MARVCRAYHMRPADYWALTVEEDLALVARLDAEDKASEKAAKKAKAKRRR